MARVCNSVSNFTAQRYALTTERQPPMLVICLSDSAPVEIDPELWPVVADAYSHDKLALVRVRKHDDGRCVVYGNDCGTRPIVNAGFVVSVNGDVPRAIRRVVGLLKQHATLADRCIQSLPPVRL